MSERGFAIGSKRSNHGKHGRKTRNPSYFPRHEINKYEGTHLPMSGSVYKKYRRRYKDAYPRGNQLIKFIESWVGRKFDDFFSDFSDKVNETGTSHTPYELVSDHFANYADGWRYRWCDFTVDEEGIIRETEEKNRHFNLKRLSHYPKLNKRHIAWNDEEWAKACERIGNPECRYGRHVSGFKHPYCIGEYYIIKDRRIVKKPVYIIQSSKLTYGAELLSRDSKRAQTYAEYMEGWESINIYLNSECKWPASLERHSYEVVIEDSNGKPMTRDMGLGKLYLYIKKEKSKSDISD